MSQTLQGILPVLPTPFSNKGAVDLRALGLVTEFAVGSGVQGVVYPGFASEVEHLSPDEREQALSQVVASCAGRVAIVAGASAESVAEVVSHGRVAAKMGIHWLMIQPPKSVGNQADDVVGFLNAVCAQLPSMQMVLQNAPAPRGSDLSPQTIIDIVESVSQIGYIKEETLPAGPAISTILESKPSHLLGVIGGGGARYILDEYTRGACAAMPAVEIADLHVQLDAAWRANDKPSARTLYIQTLPLLSLQAIYRMRLTKLVMMRRGVFTNTSVRAPTPELDAIATADIDAQLLELGLLSSPDVTNG